MTARPSAGDAGRPVAPSVARSTGRPPASSRRTLEDAACELFLERGFAATSMDDIARRAGLSRASVFNYVSAKSDLLWVDVDELLDAVEAALDGGTAPGDALRAAAAGPHAVPLAVTQAELIGAPAEVLASGMLRVARLAALLTRRLGSDAAYPLTGALVAAWRGWASAGTGRGSLAAALAPVLP
jgi:AcrR family transcriptional regulator